MGSSKTSPYIFRSSLSTQILKASMVGIISSNSPFRKKGNKQLGEQKGNKGTSGQTTTQGRTGQTGFAQGGAQGRVSINEQQRTRIHDVVVNKNFTSRFRASNVNFDVRVGTRIPRSFHLFAVPEDIVVIAPRFRGFRFFIVEDEIVFVDPVTFEIVAVMPV
jgi:hypothetical protein